MTAIFTFSIFILILINFFFSTTTGSQFCCFLLFIAFKKAIYVAFGYGSAITTHSNGNSYKKNQLITSVEMILQRPFFLIAQYNSSLLQRAIKLLDLTKVPGWYLRRLIYFLELKTYSLHELASPTPLG